MIHQTKPYTIKFIKDYNNEECYKCDLRFKHEPVKLRDMLEALVTTNQTKLDQVFDRGLVHVYAKRYPLGVIKRETYQRYLQQRSDNESQQAKER